MEEKISGISSGRLTRLACDSMNWPRRAAEKNGETDRTSSWAAKSRCSGPMQSVMIADVKVLMLLASRSSLECGSFTFPPEETRASSA